MGTSFLNPASAIIDLLKRLHVFGEQPLPLVPFDNSREGILAEIGRGEYDILEATCDSRAWLARCRSRALGHTPCVAPYPRGTA